MNRVRNGIILIFLYISLCVSFVNLQKMHTLQNFGALETTSHLTASVSAGYNLTYNFTYTPKIVGLITYHEADMLRFRIMSISFGAPINGSFADCTMGYVDFYNSTTHTWTLDWLGFAAPFLISAYNGTHPLHTPFGNFTWVSPFFMAVMIPNLMTPILSIAPNNQSSVNESLVLFYQAWFTSTFPSLNYSWDYSNFIWNFWAGSYTNQTTRFEYKFNTDLLCISTKWYANNSDNTGWELIYQLDLVPEQPPTSPPPTEDYSIFVLYNNFLAGVQRFNESLWWVGSVSGTVIVTTVLISWSARRGNKSVKVKLKLPKNRR